MKITITKQEYQTIVRCLKTSEILIRGYNSRDEDMIRKTRKKLQRSNENRRNNDRG
jgi:hypothetical protein|nr:MAG TPA: hypothetical protein [Caudoviricetes sp.]